MADILDYIAWRGDLDFRERDFTVPDFLILAEFALYDLTDIVDDKKSVTLKELRNQMYKLKRENVPVGLLAPRDMLGLLNACADSKRFCNVVFHDRIDVTRMEEDMQITAITADIGNDVRVVIYSGTGDKIIAWKEDFVWMYLSPSPAQTMAAEYLDAQAKGFHGDLYVCGHSKGGNLTLFSSIHCSPKTQKKIKYCYSFDGPGLSKEDTEFLKNSPMYDKVVNVIPEGSIVGRLFYHQERVQIVRSINKGLMQHDAFNWLVNRDGFIAAKKNVEYSDVICKLTTDVIEGMDLKTRRDFTEALYKMLFATGSTTLMELSKNGKEMGNAFKSLDSYEKKLVLDVSGKLFGEREVRKLLMDNIKGIILTNGRKH